MKYCSKCGKELFDEAIICPGCGCAVVNPEINQIDDKANVGLCILSALIPLFGFLYWAVKHKESPKKAQACGTTAIISFVVSLTILYA